MVRSSAGAIEWSVVSKHWGLSRIALPKLELLAGQHRQTALHKYIDETGGVVDNDFNWVVNVYNLTTIPRNLLIDLSGNAGSTQMPQTSAETFRDMAAVVPYLAANDKIVIQPRLGRQPTADEYLRASANGDKAKIERAFRENLSICAAPKVHKSLDKYRVVLTTPMRAELERFCNSGVGMEIFTLGMAYEMASSCCYQVSSRSQERSKTDCSLVLVFIFQENQRLHARYYTAHAVLRYGVVEGSLCGAASHNRRDRQSLLGGLCDDFTRLTIPGHRQVKQNPSATDGCRISQGVSRRQEGS